MEALRRQRGTVKAKLTRLGRKVEVDVQSEAQPSREQIEVYTSRLEEIRSEFDVQRRIIAMQVDETSSDDEAEDEAFEDRYLKLKVQLKQMVRNVPIPQNEARLLQNDDALMRVLQQQADIMQQLGNNGAQAPMTNNDAITRLVTQQAEVIRRFTEEGGAISNESRVRLPIVKIPTFDGRAEEWKRFSETFQSLIHNNESIPNIQKFQYLITSLTGAATKIIESIELPNENYTVAWNLLLKRYDDPRAIKKKHIQCLFAMPRVEKESSSAIRELVDYTMKHLRILNSMDLPTNSWHELIIHMMEAKLDNVTLRAWEQSGDPAIGTLENLTDFLQTRCRILERIEARSKQKEVARANDSEKHHSKFRNQAKSTQGEKSSTLTITNNAGKCYLCQGGHFLYHCDKFLAMQVDERFKEVQRLKLCINCLRNDHFIKTCRMGACRECSGRHNTLLHRPTSSKGATKEEDTSESSSSKSTNDPSSNVAVHHASKLPQRQYIIMATAIVDAARSNGSNATICILLDSASEANFVTQAACNKLGVKRDRTSEIVTGLNEIESSISQSCNIVIQSRQSSYRVNVHCLVVPTITKNLPSIEIDLNTVKIPSNLKLADTAFYKPNSIDMLIGAEFFFDLLETGKIKLGENHPVLMNTKLGWVVAGSIPLTNATSSTCIRNTIATLNCSLKCDTLNKTLEKFWEIENIQVGAIRTLTADEQRCKEIFEQTITRDDSGRFVVRLPFRGDPSKLGASRDIALRRLNQLERRFKRDKSMQERYVKFMREYLELKHMSPVNNISQEHRGIIVYLPHHCVFKESSSSTKIRTVFDASSKTDSGVALNDILYVGPNLQSSLIEIVTRFRFHQVALTGDLRKMYRQIKLHELDRDFQRILWRETPEEVVQEFRLNTVTYGEASSSYLAVKCIRKLAEQAMDNYPIAARVIFDEMYVDDIMAGADNIEDAIELERQLTTLLRTGGFEVHKWCSNCPEVLDHLPQERRETGLTLSINTNDTIKTLGLEWNPRDDTFQFFVKQTEPATTKRQILSAISKFFDPLGLIGPIVTTAKLLMQETWRLDYKWDENLPPTFVEKWERFRQDLTSVETLIITRRVIACERPKRVFLQGFCDASEGAYGACLYVQAEDDQGILTSRLLCSKSRIAPIKTTSIPRLELCSAVLLARLMASVRKSLRIQIDGLQAWTDSTVALCWIRGEASRWKPFVANRVIEITQILPAEHWNHVRGEENPADLISRGTNFTSNHPNYGGMDLDGYKKNDLLCKENQASSLQIKLSK